MSIIHTLITDDGEIHLTAAQANSLRTVGAIEPLRGFEGAPDEVPYGVSAEHFDDFDAGTGPFTFLEAS